MADDPHNTSDISDRIGESKEDADTRVARKELRQTAISDKDKERRASQDSDSSQGSPAEDAEGRAKTPDLGAKSDELRDQVSSPKKKRAHDELDHKDGEGDDDDNDDDNDGANGVTATRENGGAAGSRTDRSEPEKKRARDESTSPEPEKAPSAADEAAKAGDGTSTTTTKDAARPAKSAQPPTAASAFASSGFSKLATSTSSPFGALGTSTKPSVFGPAAASGSASSPLASIPASKPAAAPTLTFGSLSGPPPTSFGGGGAFGAASTFGSSAFGGSAFGNALSGTTKLANWATPGEALKSHKPARPFGAPDSDVEDGSDDDGGGGDDDEESTGEEADGDEAEKEKEEAKAAAPDEKKKTKLQRITVDDGEAGEATILQVRARLYHLDTSADPTWRERGGGMLKINVPESCVELDDTGRAIPGSFDASGLEDEDEEAGSAGRKMVRLLMRQDSTLRVILNTVLVPAMEFQEKQSLKATSILFTAFEGDNAKPVSMSIKLNAANAKTFLDEVGLIKRELQQA